MRGGGYIPAVKDGRKSLREEVELVRKSGAPVSDTPKWTPDMVFCEREYLLQLLKIYCRVDFKRRSGATILLPFSEMPLPLSRSKSAQADHRAAALHGSEALQSATAGIFCPAALPPRRSQAKKIQAPNS